MDEIIQRLSQLTDAELRTELKAAGQSCGGIAKTTRKFFEKRLAKHLLAKTQAASSDQDTTDGAARPAADGAARPAAVAAETQNPGAGEEGKLQPTVEGVRNSDEQREEKSKCEESRQAEGAKDTSSVRESAPSDGSFYVVQVPTEDVDMDVPDAPTFKAPLCSGRVYQNRKEALDVVKKSKGARFKVFKSQEDAEAFVNSHQDLSTPKRTEPVSRVASTNGVQQQVSENASSFHSLKTQQLVVLRHAIEANNHVKFKELVWNNPRYLISSADTPTILKEGPRYHALHVTAIYNLASMCKLILETLEDPQFFALMYPDDSPETQQRRQEMLVNMYLNTPDGRGNIETPLHFASKFGNPEVVKVLVDHPMCDKTAKNKEGKTARQIVCSRGGTAETTKRIIRLLEDNYYVPVLRSEDNSTQPVIGEPWSPDHNSLHQVTSGIHPREESPVDATICTKAYAGPMSPSEAETFHKHLRTPPSAESKRAAAIRRGDGDKGLERVARELARSMHVPWAEYWDFLDAYVDLSTNEGLMQLEEYLQRKQPACDKDHLGGDQNDKTEHQSGSTTDIISNLMEDFERLTLADTETHLSQEPTSRTSNPESDSKIDRNKKSSENNNFMTTYRRKACEQSDGTASYGAKMDDESKLEANDTSQAVITKEQQGDGNLDFRVDGEISVECGVHGKDGLGAIPTHANATNDKIKSNSFRDSSGILKSIEPENMEVTSAGNQQIGFGNGDNSGVLMETPKSRHTCSLFNRQLHDHHVEPVFLMGNEATKLDLDVLRAISYVNNLDNYPCVKQWRQQVESVPEDCRKSWPTPAKYRSRKLASTPNVSPHSLSPSQRLLRYGSPIPGGTPSGLLMGSPHLLRSRHVSDPGMVGHHRRVYTASPRGANNRAVAAAVQDMPSDPRLRLFP